MKGFLAAMLSAADKASRLSLKEPLKLVLSYDEEVGCTGIARMKDRLAPLLGQPRAVIVGEPTSMQVATGHKGKQAFHAVITGQAGHSALAPRFVNALNVAADFIRALAEIQGDLAAHGARDLGYDIPYSTVHVGTLTGGRALNIVPDRAEMSFELRHLATDDPETLRDRIEAAARRVSQAYGSEQRIAILPLAAYPGIDVAETEEVVDFVQRLAQTGRTKVAFGTEAGVFAGLGIPTVVCGPGSMERQGHKADEYLERSDLAACEAMLDRLLVELQS
jgi:acetylornithine deacetylase